MSSKGGNHPTSQAKTTPPQEQEIRVSIDWLRYTMPYTIAGRWRESVEQALPRDDRIFVVGKELPNARGYDKCLELSIGRVHIHTERIEQGISVEFTGQDCVKLHGMGFAWDELWDWIELARGKISTIHFAIDVIGYGADHLEAYRAIDSGEAVAAAKTKHAYIGGKVGEGRTEGTTYIGSSASDRQMRIYNKAAERGVKGDWTRIELVIRGRRAERILDTLQGAEWATVGRSAIGAFMQWDGCTWWNAAMQGDVIDLPKVERKVSNTHEWLLRQCLPALQRELMESNMEAAGILADQFQSVIDWFIERRQHPSP